MKKISMRTLIISIILIIIGICLLLIYPSSLDNQLTGCYTALIMLYFFITILIIYVISRKDFDIFEPINIMLFMYLGIFSIRPILDIVNSDYYTMGINTMDSCIKSTIIVAISIVAFSIGYYNKFKIRDNKEKNNLIEKNEKSKNKILLVSWIIWIISFVMTIISLLISGKSLSYILSFGSSGVVDDELISNNVAALTFFAYSMLAPWMYILINGKNKVIKALITFLMLSTYIVKGTRIVLLVMISAPIIYYYLKRGKRPKIETVSIAIILILLFMSFIQMIRSGLRLGTEVDKTGFAEVAITNVFDADLTTYKQFYRIVSTYPDVYSYTLGRAMIQQTLITIIPRNIWPSKPEPVITDVIRNSINEKARIAGLAAPGLGEYYFEFGIIGCVVCMFILGSTFRRWKYILKNHNSTYLYIKYALLYGLMFQLIIRTSTASCVYQYIFTIFPMYIANIISFNNKK